MVLNEIKETTSRDQEASKQAIKKGKRIFDHLFILFPELSAISIGDIELTKFPNSPTGRRADKTRHLSLHDHKR